MINIQIGAQLCTTHLLSFFPPGFSAVAGIYSQYRRRKGGRLFDTGVSQLKRAVDRHCWHLVQNRGRQASKGKKRAFTKA